MPTIDSEKLDVFLLEETVWIAAAKIDSPSYDFAFQTFFACRHPYQRPEKIQAVGRFGVTDNYADFYLSLEAKDILLIHTPEQHLLASELTHWHPLLADLTPPSRWYDAPPPAEEIEKHFSYPVFVKGSRQTSKHKADLSIIRSRNEYEFAAEQYKNNPILHWQQFVCREFVELRSVPSSPTEKIPPSFEFRTFWWRGQCVGSGIYWADFASYSWTDAEKFAALKVAQKAAQHLDIVFLVVDVAQTRNGEWIVIECNDGQESGYAGIAPIVLWRKIIDTEREYLESVAASKLP